MKNLTTETGNSRAESREPRAESREPRAESREPRAESREPRAGSNIFSGHCLIFLSFITVFISLNAGAAQGDILGNCRVGYTTEQDNSVPDYIPRQISYSKTVGVSCGLSDGSANYCVTVQPDKSQQNKFPGYYYMESMPDGGRYIPVNLYRADGSVWGGTPGGIGQGVTGQMSITGGGVFSGYDSFPYTAKIGLPGGYAVDHIPGMLDDGFAVTYNATLTVNSDLNIPAANLCASPPPPGSVTVTNPLIRIWAYVVPACHLIIMKNVKFQASLDLSNVPVARGNFLVKCSKGIYYAATVGTGQNNSDPAAPRKMRCRSGSGSCNTNNTITYDLYQNAACTKRWDPQQPVPGGLFIFKDYDVYGKITPGQKPVPPGTYSDAVVVSVTMSANP